MKATKKIVGATAALVAAVALSAGSTFAWFATNSTVTATGLSVGVTESTNANLLIRALQSDGSAYTAYGSTAAFNHGTKKFTPSTHDSNYTSYSSGLKACGDASKVDPITGIYSGDSWTQTTEGTHYFDYTVQLANAGVDSYSGEYLTATLSGTTALAMQYAISIDFYYQSTASTNYAGTINLAGIELNGTGTGNYHTIYLDDSTVTIPAAGTGNNQAGLSIIMRVYVDGALKQTGTSAYVNSAAAVPTDGLALSVSFALTTTAPTIE